MKSIFVMLAAVVALSLANDARAQEQAFANRASELKDRPANDARTLAPVAAEAPVKVLARQGAWTQVETGGRRGWMRVFHLRFPSTVESGGGGALSGLTGVFGFGQRKQAETSRVATLGIRGLSAEDFQSASPDPAALRKLQSWRSDKASAERFAREGKLAPVPVAYADASGAQGGRK